jgi:hypothetical protein
MRTAFAVAAALLLAGAPVTAQTISGVLLDATTHEPIASGTLALLSDDSTIASVVADDSGSFTLRAPRGGSYQLRGERIGYNTAITPPLDLSDGDTLRVEFRLSAQAVVLNPITVLGYSGRPAGPLGGFYERARRGLAGRFITREDIDARNPIRTTDMLMTMPGVRVVPSRRGSGSAVLLRGCAPRVYLDGMPIRLAGMTIDDLVQPLDLEGIEVYSGPAEVPGEFAFGTSCGAIILWTRRSE